jgi:hypothetical protein
MKFREFRKNATKAAPEIQCLEPAGNESAGMKIRSHAIQELCIFLFQWRKIRFPQQPFDGEKSVLLEEPDLFRD